MKPCLEFFLGESLKSYEVFSPATSQTKVAVFWGINSIRLIAILYRTSLQSTVQLSCRGELLGFAKMSGQSITYHFFPYNQSS